MRFDQFATIRRTLGHRDYGLYSAGNSVSLVGNWIQRVAVGWLAWELTHSGAWLGLVAMADLSPALVLGPLGGAVADRGGRLRLIQIVQGISLLVSLALAALVVTDAFPVHFLPRMTQAAARKLDVRLDVVDSLGLVPVAYPEREFTVAHSFRRWLQKNLPSLWHPPSADALGRDLAGATIGPDIHHRWPALGLGRPTGGEPLPETHLRGTPGTVSHRGGEAMARHLWQDFVRQRLDRYAEDRNHPDLPGSTRLSAWIHFGHIGVWELVDELTRTWDPTTAAPATAKRDWWGLGEPVDALLEELINWRELCAVQAHKDPGFTTYEGLPAWARTTLDDHRDDPRPTLYSLDELEQAQTDDELWNAAQRELVQTGQMHNAMRMLWGKRVLAWSATPEEAFERLVTLNNRWALDGRDPNSWGGIGWVFGRFDRAWGPERPIYGKVRYMTSASSRRKWRMRDYLTTYGP